MFPDPSSPLPKRVIQHSKIEDALVRIWYSAKDIFVPFGIQIDKSHLPAFGKLYVLFKLFE